MFDAATKIEQVSRESGEVIRIITALTALTALTAIDSLVRYYGSSNRESITKHLEAGVDVHTSAYIYRLALI